jgi:hypothetical protein
MPHVLASQVEGWAAALYEFYTGPTAMALKAQDLRAITTLCKKIDNLPRTDTIHQFAEEGIRLNLPVQGHHTDLLYTGDKAGMPIMLKKLSEVELQGYTKLRRLGENIMDHHLTPFEMFEAPSPPPAAPSRATAPEAPASSLAVVSGGRFQGRGLSRTPPEPSAALASPPAAVRQPRSWVWMPQMSRSLDALSRPLDAKAVVRLIQHMFSALDFLHQRGLAHMDVKPANILVDHLGKYFLADFGSVKDFGTQTMNTTPAFVPQDLRHPVGVQYRVSREHDFWMLGMTIADMTSQRPEEQVGAGVTDFSSDEVKEALTVLDTDAARRLLARLGGR